MISGYSVILIHRHWLCIMPTSIILNHFLSPSHQNSKVKNTGGSQLTEIWILACLFPEHLARTETILLTNTFFLNPPYQKGIPATSPSQGAHIQHMVLLRLKSQAIKRVHSAGPPHLVPHLSSHSTQSCPASEGQLPRAPVPGLSWLPVWGLANTEHQ